jgi:hypothetical protein
MYIPVFRAVVLGLYPDFALVCGLPSSLFKGREADKHAGRRSLKETKRARGPQVDFARLNKSMKHFINEREGENESVYVYVCMCVCLFVCVCVCVFICVCVCERIYIYIYI